MKYPMCIVCRVIGFVGQYTRTSSRDITSTKRLNAASMWFTVEMVESRLLFARRNSSHIDLLSYRSIIDRRWNVYAMCESRTNMLLRENTYETQ